MQKKKAAAPVEETKFNAGPRRNCPHIKMDWINETQSKSDKFDEIVNKAKCADCDDTKQLWVCIPCGGIYCSSYVKGHMNKHFQATKDPIAFCLFSGYFWCYECDGYITSIQLNLLRNKFAKVMFPDGQDEDELDRLAAEFSECLKVNEHKVFEPKPKVPKVEVPQTPPFTREDLVEGLRNKKFNKIVFLTGAGISVAAGIPDFRTPGTGLYSQMGKYNLPQPESVFHIEYFRTNPEPFYMLTKQSFKADVKPVISHKFIKKLNDEEVLLKAVTQNIDGLQLDAGLPSDKLIQAHGHIRSARCIECKKQVDIKDWNKAIESQTILRCSCDKNGLVKTDVVFFGEPLPKQFQEAFKLVKEADLVIVMGTSLLVMPFAFLIEVIGEDVPLVLINNTDSRKDKKKPKSLWLDGSIDDRIKTIADDLKWEL